MYSAENYVNHNEIPRKDAKQCLEEYVSKVTWNKDSDLVVIDIGSGDGSVTSKILQKYLPNNFKELLGSDKCEEMVKFASEHYLSQRVSFEVLDIATTLPEHHYNRFDHVFSFYALQWVQKQRIAFSNIYDLLAPGGSTLLTIVGTYPAIYDVYVTLSRSTKWKRLLYCVNDIISPFHDCPEADIKTQTFMTDIGFTDVEVTRKKSSYCHGSAQDFKKFVRAVNGFPIPEDVFDEYLCDFVQVAQSMGYIDQNYGYEYDFIIVYGKKPKLVNELEENPCKLEINQKTDNDPVLGGFPDVSSESRAQYQ